jgi:hypothetical protein
MSDRMPCGCTVTFTAQFGPELKYCWRHEENHALAAERRRHALLQATMELLTDYRFQLYCEMQFKDNYEMRIAMAAEFAENTLAAIEKRETK